MINRVRNGFSLIELMIVVAIIAILAAIAVPSYRTYIQESRRSDAYVALTSAAAEQERIYIYDNSYSNNIADLGGSNSPEGHYVITLTATDSTFTLTATAASGSTQFLDTNCRTFTLNNLGVRGSSNSGGGATGDCW
ncbi:type IV pilin protein [Endozoicomonas elysicola]|uniref:Pilus assembly protein PilE n=1 Tax=Endozoicomonas elysicola TaxID=305900 RepID=A0A081KFB0_9GAMM|nr:type IV pilin protein [Endozoicomonas elysicola]KEI72836.1 hypothetical protein GV64_20805 [Endozoicomonas elysicola]